MSPPPGAAEALGGAGVGGVVSVWLSAGAALFGCVFDGCVGVVGVTGFAGAVGAGVVGAGLAGVVGFDGVWGAAGVCGAAG